MVPYPEVTIRKRFSKCTKQNFPSVRFPGDTVPRAVDKSEASLQTKISCSIEHTEICSMEGFNSRTIALARVLCDNVRYSN